MPALSTTPTNPNPSHVGLSIVIWLNGNQDRNGSGLNWDAYGDMDMIPQIEEPPNPIEEMMETVQQYLQGEFQFPDDEYDEEPVDPAQAEP